MLGLFGRLKRDDGRTHSIRDYQALVRRHLRRHPQNRRLALANVIGAETLESFDQQGDGHVLVLRHNGLRDGDHVYDLGCGCGRTAQALQRSGWRGHYTGADVVPELLAELEQQCPGYKTALNYQRTIVAPDASLDVVYAWSVMTHLFPGETYLYMIDAFRALKPGGRLLFSFLELEEPEHDRVWHAELKRWREGQTRQQLDAFLHRDWIRRFARDAGFEPPVFTDGTDATNHPPFWQALAVMAKPGV